MELQEAYNTARRAENERREGFFSNAFDEKIMVPHRPMAPWVPDAYMGPAISYAAPVPALADNFYLEPIATRQTQNSEFRARLNKYGTFSSEQVFNQTGKVFGITGQGEMNMPGEDAMAFFNQITDTTTGVGATDQAVMMVSIFPTDQTTAGVATRNITIQASSVPFFANFTAMEFTPETPEAIEMDLVAGVDGAKALTAGVALAAISLSLF